VPGPDDLPPPPPPPAFAPPPLSDIVRQRDGDRSGVVLLLGVVLTALLCAALVAVWPDDEGDARTETAADAFAGFATTVPGATGEPSRGIGGGVGATTTGPTTPAVSLFAGGASGAVADIVAEAGQPDQLYEILLYPTYAFVAYRDPVEQGHIDQRQWRDGEVSDAEPNTIDDRVDADTEPGLFTLEGLDLGRIPQLVADAGTRYDVPVDVTHIIIDRFLPFDERVLIRVYASPSDGRSGGGYVTYDLAGTFQKVCC
jgi:hypothetical protein